MEEPKKINYGEKDIESAGNILDKIGLEAEALKIAKSYITKESIIEAVNLLNSAKRIIFVGEGCSGRVAECASMRTTQIKIPEKGLHFFTDSTTPVIEIGDVAIVVTTSGETGTKLVMEYKAYGAELIVLSSDKGSTIGGIAKVFIHIPSKEQILNDYPEFAKQVAKYSNWALLNSISETLALIFLNEFVGEWAHKTYHRTWQDFKKAHHINR